MDRRGFFNRLSHAFKAFTEAFLTAGLQDERSIKADFTDFNARRLRYEIYWAFYENTMYRDIHKWARKYKSDYALYRYIRGIKNPTRRLGDFYEDHLFGGVLDPLAGDGKTTPTAIPIIVPKENEKNEAALRAGIAQIWAWSNFASKKNILSLHGSVLGDVFIEVVDDTDLGQVYLDTIHPGKIQDFEADRKGNIKSYSFVELRKHPEYERTVTYLETCRNDGGTIVYNTYLDGEPYPWDTALGEEWTVDYGFVPMVHVMHKDVGLQFGWSELHQGRVKFQELDDLVSKFHDHIRKTVDPPWFLSGVSKSKVTSTLSRTEQEPDSNDTQPDRESLPAFYATNPQAKAKAMVADLPIGEVAAYIKDAMEELKEEYPELSFAEELALTTNSSRAIRAARQRAEAKVQKRRPHYDDGLIRAQKMALSIGGYRNIIDGFDLNSFDTGAEEHFIANRPVFGKDPLDDLEIEEKFWTVGALAIPQIGLRNYLEMHGWEQDKVEQAVKGNEEVQEKEIGQFNRFDDRNDNRRQDAALDNDGA